MLISNRTNTILLALILAVGIGIVAMLASGVRGGPLDPPGPPSATGTLPQVEPRNPIPPVGWNGTFPITISQPGSYFLTGNITAPSGKDGIVIATPSVTLDLNGFTLAGQPPQYGIADDGTVARKNIVIRNGTITGWRYGVYGTFFVRSTFEDLIFTGEHGLDIGSGNTVRRVTSTENTFDGITISQRDSYYGGTVEDSNLSGNGFAGLYLVANNITVRHNIIDGNHTGVVIGNAGLNWLEDNDITGNITAGVSLASNSGKNTVVGNFITQNATPVDNTGIGNVIGTLTATEAGSTSWSNISYP